MPMASVYAVADGSRVVVRFAEWECWVLLERYENGRAALRLVDVADHSPVARATVNRPDVLLGEDEVLIKDYSENAGILDALERAGVLQRTGQTIASGYAMLIVARLLTA
jgi:hypothetical protein